MHLLSQICIIFLKLQFYHLNIHYLLKINFYIYYVWTCTPGHNCGDWETAYRDSALFFPSPYRFQEKELKLSGLVASIYTCRVTSLSSKHILFFATVIVK